MFRRKGKKQLWFVLYIFQRLSLAKFLLFVLIGSCVLCGRCDWLRGLRTACIYLDFNLRRKGLSCDRATGDPNIVSAIT